LFEIGASLKEARLRQGLDFPEIETGTKIRGKYLNALEEERFDVLPAEAYIKGFLRTYAEYLGLDGQLYVDEFNSRYVAPEEKMQSIRVRRTAQARRHRRVQGGVLIAALAGIAIVTALVIVAWTSGSAPDQHLAGIPPSGSTQQKKHNRTQPQSAKAHITLRAVRTMSRCSRCARVGRRARYCSRTSSSRPARRSASRGARCGSTPAPRGTCALSSTVSA
jgi:Uncharacterized protein conserved in bacteria